MTSPTLIPTGIEDPQSGSTGCHLAPIVVPTKPSVIPQANQLDVTTGLHMTGSPQVIDLATYHLKVSGKVDHPFALSYDDLRCLPKVSRTAVLECVGFFVDSATWSGVPIQAVLGQAGVQADATSVRLVSADGYQVSIHLDDALNPDNFLAYELQGKPVPIIHGFPLRAVFPQKTGSFWVKWLTELVVE
jgi:sulfite dehydrogenase (cytochrome) subunit A